MLLFLNDRILVRGQRLKTLVVAPELGVTAPQAGVDPPDLRVTFGIRSETDAERSVVWLRPYEGKSFAHLRVPFSYAELSTENLEAGTYLVRASTGSDSIDQRRVVVLDSAHHEEIAKTIGSDGFRGESKIEKVDHLVQIWLKSWRDLYEYLGCVIPSHVVAVPRRVDDRIGSVAWPSAEALAWISFHVNRFAFDQLFYGGVVALVLAPGAGMQLRLVLQYRMAPTDENKAVDPAVGRLARLLQDKTFKIRLTWNRISPPAAPFASQIHLDLSFQ